MHVRRPLAKAGNMAEVSFEAFPIGVPQTIDFEPYPGETSADSVAQFREASYWNGYSKESTGQREEMDQWLDWLLLAVGFSSDLPTAQLNQVFFDLPPVRRSVLQHIANLEYGVTRSRLVGKNEVIALIPVGPPADSMVHLAHIADEQRKNLGETPSRFYVFEYAIDPGSRTATIVRRNTLNGGELFGETAGYYERTVSSARDLEEFLSHSNDVTYASLASGKVRIGGRQVPQFRGISVGDVAAIWSSEQGGVARSRGSGFSLDPQFDLAAIRRDKDRLIAVLIILGQMSGRPMDQGRVQNLRSELNGGDVGGYVNAIKEVCGNGAMKAQCQGLAKDFLLRHRFQKARYDGSLQGTEVGMVLFYTDLLMKLWSLDYQSSTPRKGQVEGFPNELRMSVARVYSDEVERFPETRLWLGSLEKGFQIGPNRTAIFLARNATRVFAVPHNFLENKDVEESAEPHIYDRIFMTWWNQHYEEVAQYENQYQRLNEIMKWSQIIGWLNTASDGAGLAFLNSFSVKRDNWFPTWVEDHSELTFHDWKSVGFYGHNYQGSQTEALPILVSKKFDNFGEENFWEGGVSLARREAIAARSALTEDFPAFARRGDLDYSSSDLATGRLRTLEKVEYRLTETEGGRFSTVARPDTSQRLRGLIGEFRGTTFESSVERHSSEVSVSVRSGSTPLGDLRIHHSANGFQIGWTARDVDAGQVLARKISFATDPEAVLRNDESVGMFVRTTDSTYFVKPKSSEAWVKLQISQNHDSALVSGFDARISGLGKDSKDVDVAWIKQEDMSMALPQDGFIQIPLESGADAGKSLTVVGRPPPGTRSISTEYLGGKITMGVDDASGRAFARIDKLPVELRLAPEKLRLLVRTHQLGQQSLREAGLIRDFEGGNFRAVAEQVTEDPQHIRQIVDQRLRGLLQEYDRMAIANPSAARQQLQAMALQYGDLPDIRLRFAVEELTRGNGGHAVELAQSLQQRALRDSNLFLDEINLRIVNASDPVEAENLAQLRSYASWMSDRNTARLVPGARLVTKSEGGRFIAEYDVVHLPSQSTSIVDVFSSPRSLVYIQDSPGLNNLDVFSPVGQKSLETMVQSGRITVEKVAVADLAHYRPGLVLEQEPKVSLRLVENGRPVHTYRPQTTKDCGGNEASDKTADSGCENAYLISESTGKSAPK